jgi:hypothetical protein
MYAPYILSYHFPWHLPPATGVKPLTPGQNLFCPPVLPFWRRKIIKDIKRHMAYLLA